MNYILKINSHYVCSREFNLRGSVSYSDIKDAALDEMVADFMAGEWPAWIWGCEGTVTGRWCLGPVKQCIGV